MLIAISWLFRDSTDFIQAHSFEASPAAAGQPAIAMEEEASVMLNNPRRRQLSTSGSKALFVLPLNRHCWIGFLVLSFLLG